MRRSLRLSLERQKHELRRQQAVAHAMEARFVSMTCLQMRTLLWRARRYLNDGQPEAADALLELLPEPIARSFLDWYFNEEIYSP